MSPADSKQDLEPSNPVLRSAIDAWSREARTAQPCPWEHRVWNRTSVRSLLASISDTGLSDGFERLERWPERQKDFFMYVVLGVLGGLFVDADVKPLKPFGKFADASIGLPDASFRKARLVVGVEAQGSEDEARRWRWANRIQLTAWAVASAPGHPVPLNAARRYLESLGQLQSSWVAAHTEYAHSIAMGPGLLTSAVDQWLLENQRIHLEQLPSVSSGFDASIFDDTVVLGIDGFGCGQPHSGSRPCNSTNSALLQHLFSGTWKPVPHSMWDDDDDGSRRRRRRSPGDLIDWRLPGLALMAHAASAGVELTWEIIRLFFSQIVPFEPPLLTMPPNR